MERVSVAERPHWRELANELGFVFHTIDGAPYWDETAYYRFTLKQIEDDLEEPTQELNQMCMDLVGRVVNDEAQLTKLCIPPTYWDFIRESWNSGQPHLYGRMDFAYSGKGPAKLYELNYDTPTSLYESAFFQWVWLEQAQQLGLIPAGLDQFNSIQETLIETFQFIGPRLGAPMYFASVKQSKEDRGTVQYLADCAAQAGVIPRLIDIEDIGISADGRFTDLDDDAIAAIFKLYPWEYMFREAFGQYLPNSQTVFFEPPWKSILSNKAVLPLLWEMYPHHPNLLESHFEDPARATSAVPAGWVRKPFFSREGANITLCQPDGAMVSVDGPYTDCPTILQRYQPVPNFAGNFTLVGSWVVADRACGLSIREDTSVITKDTSRFLPHVIV